MTRPIARILDSIDPMVKPALAPCRIVMGCPTVLAEGMFVARVNDFTLCLPHGSFGLPTFSAHPGFIIGPAAPNVLVGGSPAAADKDIAMCLATFPALVQSGASSTFVTGAGFWDYLSLLNPDWGLLVPGVGPIFGSSPWGLAFKSVVAFNTALVTYVVAGVAVGAGVVAGVVAAVVLGMECVPWAVGTQGNAALPGPRRACHWGAGVSAFLDQENLVVSEEDELDATMYLL